MNHDLEMLERRTLLAGVPVGTFGTNGSASFQINPHTYSYNSTDVANDDSGRIIVGGLFYYHDQFSLIRVGTTGRLDKSYGGGDGYAVIPTAPINPSSSTPTFQIAVDHAGRTLVLAGNKLYRVRSDGLLDKSFGTSGSEVVPVVTTAADLRIDSKNRAIIIGTSQGVTGTRATVLRLGVNGALDTSFGSGGAYKRPVPIDPNFNQAGNGTGAALSIQPDGKIVAAASTRYKYDNESSRDYVNGAELFRLKTDGSIDTTYARKGHVELALRDDDVNNGGATLDALLPDGSAVIAQSTSSFDSPTFIGDRDWAIVDANGKVARDHVSLAPTTVTPRPNRFDIHTLGEDSSGRLIERTAFTVYRLSGKYKLDTTFSQIDGFVSGLVNTSPTTLTLFSQVTIGTGGVPGVKLEQVSA